MEAFVREGFGDTLGMGPTGPQVGVEVNPNLWREIAPERVEHLVLMSSLLDPSEMPVYQELRQRLTKKSCVVTNDTLGALREKVGLDVYVESVKGKFYRPGTFNPTPVAVKLHRSYQELVEESSAGSPLPGSSYRCHIQTCSLWPGHEPRRGSSILRATSAGG